MGKSVLVSSFPPRARRKASLRLVLLAALFAAPACAQNFHDLVNREYCDSVIATRRGECVSLNSTKNAKCSAPGKCEFDKHVSQIADYKAAIAQRDSGAIASADMDALKKKIEKLKEELDERREGADKIEKAARECSDARQEVYDFFDDDVIPDTERVGREASDRRKALLDKLEDAKDRQRDAKDKRDNLAGADPEKDRARWEEYVKAREDYEASAVAFRDVEASLAEFNQAHGADIEDAVRKLVNYYKSEQTGHKDEIEQEKNRSELCAKLEYLSY